MNTYDKVAQQSARAVTDNYSSSFGLATKLFASSIRQDIYNIYGLVRVADEIVDTYGGADAGEQIDDLEQEVYKAIKRKFSSNPIVHAFQLTANHHKIDKQLIAPFFSSMRLDTKTQVYDTRLFKKYIDGSAEVVGLMCLRTFAVSDQQYHSLEPGARALGAAFQKVNFLRDMTADQRDLGRFYFPNTTYQTFNESAKSFIVADIEQDFQAAVPAIRQLPPQAQPAVFAAYEYYFRLLQKLSRASVEDIKARRIRIHNAVKLSLLSRSMITQKLASKPHVKK